MATQFKVSVGLIKTYPVIEGFKSLSPIQQEAVFDQGWQEDDFPCPKWEKFWEIDGVVFSTEMDLIGLGNFTFDGWTHQYVVGTEHFLARFVDDGHAIEVAKFIVEVLP